MLMPASTGRILGSLFTAGFIDFTVARLGLVGSENTHFSFVSLKLFIFIAPLFYLNQLSQKAQHAHVL
jgi:hypothetical protein